MKAIIKKASDWSYREVKEINTLKKLLKIHISLIIETDKNVIDLYKEEDKGIDCVIIIYDDYVEKRRKRKWLKKNLKKRFNDICDESKKQKEVIDKAIDKLYIWGEALDPTFQKEMLDILKGRNKSC